MIAQERIDEYILPESGPSEARLRKYGVPIWALIGHLPAVNGNLDDLARDYEIPRDVVDIALAYYKEHRAAIDARLVLNAD